LLNEVGYDGNNFKRFFFQLVVQGHF